MAAALGAVHWQASAVQTLAEKMSFIFCIKLKFEPHNELMFVSLIEGVEGKSVVAPKMK